MADDNLDQIAAWINGIVDQITFDLPGDQQSLGRDLAGTVAQGIADRAVDRQVTPDGAPLKPNAPRYAAYKAKHYKVYQPAVRTGQMLSLESLLGGTTVMAEAVEMKYGTGQPPSRTVTGVPLKNADRDITDVEKAYIVSKDRPFFALTEDDADACLDVAGKAIERMLGGL